MRAIVFLLVLLCANAAAQLRTIPAEAMPAKMRHAGENVVEVNGKPAQLSAGAQIRDASNRIILPAALPPDSPVKFTLDAAGHVHRVWILTPQEAAQKP
jgi:hypothetical protein